MDVRQLLRSDTATVHYSVPTAVADKLPSCSDWDSSLDAEILLPCYEGREPTPIG